MNILEIKPKANPWEETDNFAMQDNVISAPKEGEEPFIDTVVDSLKQTKDLVVGESKTLAPSVVDTFKKSTVRLDEDERIFSPIPNSFLYWGIIGLALIFVAKKL